LKELNAAEAALKLAIKADEQSALNLNAARKRVAKAKLSLTTATRHQKRTAMMVPYKAKAKHLKKKAHKAVKKAKKTKSIKKAAV